MPNKALKEARLAKDWRLEDLAAVTGRSVPLLSMMEHGFDGKPSTRRVIAEALDRTVEELFPGVDE